MKQNRYNKLHWFYLPSVLSVYQVFNQKIKGCYPSYSSSFKSLSYRFYVINRISFKTIKTFDIGDLKCSQQGYKHHKHSEIFSLVTCVFSERNDKFLLVTHPCISGVDLKWTDHNQSSFQCSWDSIWCQEKVSIASTLSFIFKVKASDMKKLFKT